MLKVISFSRLIKYIAVLTTFISLGIYELAQEYWKEDLALVKILSIAPWAAILIILTVTTEFVSRRLWKISRWFNKSLFPDINGLWKGEIITEDGIRIPARARITQTLLFTQIDLHTETSRSITLETTPAFEGGQYMIYYVYRSMPHDVTRASYIGSTVFYVRVKNTWNEKFIELSGHYFTDRKTIGRVRLRQQSESSKDDASFY
ncbi:hypothetical protein [Pseudomonas sp. Sample_14]|uniref:Cap15 family cyclic dinucleotide receptor domain-containing protein n=1 Tax=Pseudomonas sp. Sample_14 TaxID=2448262 RepID=UPI0010329DDA|nr:hypothetical protein [Pseudomonas sp. Sample_14]